MPRPEPSSSKLLTASVLPSRLSATEYPNMSPASGFDGLT